MITDEILAIVQSKKDALKAARYTVDGILSTKKDELSPPDFNSLYAKCVRLYQKTRPHAEDEYFPADLFRAKAPNQKPEEYRYSREMLLKTGTPTHSYWAKALSVLNRIWNEKNYSIEYPEIEGVEYADYTAKDYFEKHYPEHKSIEAFFRELVTQTKVADPNAWLCLDVKLPGEDEEIDQSKPAEPFMRIMPCYKVLDFKAGEWVLTLSDEKSWVDYGGISKKEGFVLHFRDKTGLYKIEQRGKKTEYEFSEPELLFAWNLEYLPCARLKGQPKCTDKELYYQSVFAPAIPSLNIALIDSNTLQVSKVAGAYPERWEYVDDCDAEGCEYGLIYSDDRESMHRCHQCAGAGRKNYASALSVMQIPAPKDNSMGVQSDKMHPPFAGYVEKAGLVEMLKFLDEQVEANCIRAFEFINFDVSNSNVKGSETALGKQIDMQAQFSFVMQISNEEFDALGFSINTCGLVRYGAKWEPVEIGYPQNFSIRSDADLTDEITKAKTSGIPSVALTALINEFMQSRFNSRADVDRRFNLISQADRLLPFSSMEVISKLSAGTILKWQAILHDQIDYFIAKAERENDAFWEIELADQIVILEDYAKAEEKAIDAPRFSAEDILA